MSANSVESPILQLSSLGFPWGTSDPFLFCVYHKDDYPNGDENMAPDPQLLRGRHIGNDFEIRDGWRMYHGSRVPGFPQHPHRGFETVTVLKSGYCDHSDSLGALARFGPGDAQWMTAGKGVVHSEMFPLLKPESPNPLVLFQIWLNLPAESKFADPYFTMLWSERMPPYEHRDANGGRTVLRLVAGGPEFGAAAPPPPPPDSWAARTDANVAIASFEMEAGAEYELPPAKAGVNRSLYFYKGSRLTVAERELDSHLRIETAGDRAVPLRNTGSEPAELLLLQGQPIGEPVAQYGPFVMNTQAEIQQAFTDYQTTRFGGWPWQSDDPVHPRDAGRFARHPDGREELP